ncbi:MAG: hypothetical protein NTY32_13885 [Bacteroidia bacterium]|nr:hypothetical protein [Bacteroidia bacterium]
MPKFHICSVLLVLVLLTASSCMESNLSENTYYESAWCVVQGRGSQIALITDAKEILKPSESLDSVRFKSGDRYRVFYIPLGNQSMYSTVSGSKLVEITSLQPVYVEEIRMHHAFIGTVNDPVWLNEDPFFGGGFLNFDFQFYSSDTGIKHGIHLLQDSLVGRKLYLKFGHDANGDAKTKTASALASFPTSSLEQAPDADSLIILIRDEATNHSYRLALKDTLNNLRTAYP